jgi:hypothetical protein
MTPGGAVKTEERDRRPQARDARPATGVVPTAARGPSAGPSKASARARLEHNERLIELVQLPLTKFLILLLLVDFLESTEVVSPFAALPVGLCLLFPKYRWPILAVTGPILAVGRAAHTFYVEQLASSAEIHRFGVIGIQLGAVALAFLAAEGYYRLTLRTVPGKPQARLVTRPIALLVALLVALMAGAGALRGDPIVRLCVWSFVIAFHGMLWYLGYCILDSRQRPAGTLLQRAAYLPHPVWCGLTPIPVPKGLGLLHRIEAHDARGLATTHIKAVKLAVWAYVLNYASARLHDIAYNGALDADAVVPIRLPRHLPPLRSAVEQMVHGHPYPYYVNLMTLTVSFTERLLNVTVWGGVLVACARLAGFSALRNTYKPLQSKSIADFWGRHYYYFKELMADFFFYPTFARYFKKSKKLRMMFAAFAAAGLGNFMVQLLSQYDDIGERGLWGAAVHQHVYAFYCVCLALGVGLSQVLEVQKPRAGASAAARVGAASFASVLFTRARVIAFFGLLSLVAFPEPDRNLLDYLRFYAHLLPGVS